MPRTASGVRDALQCCCCCCCYCGYRRSAAALTLLHAAAVLLSCCCCCCCCCCYSRSPPRGVGRPEIHCYAFPPRAPRGFPAPTVVLVATSDVRDVLLLLLLMLPLFHRSCYVCVAAALFFCCCCRCLYFYDAFVLLTPPKAWLPVKSNSLGDVSRHAQTARRTNCFGVVRVLSRRCYLTSWRRPRASVVLV